MIQIKYQPRYSLITRPLNPSLKPTSLSRVTVQPNPVFITDYSNTNHQYERKKKRCPLFLMNKTHKKKNVQNATIFTNQGIHIQPSFSPIKTTALDCKRSFATARPKCLQSATKRQTISTALNFTRTITPKKMQSHQNLGDFPVFYFYPKERCLQSIQTDRQSTKVGRSKSSRSNYLKQKLKSEGNEVQGKELGAWRTKEVDFDEIS